MNTASAKGQPARTPFPWVTIPIAQAAALNYLDPCPFGNRSLKAHDVAIAPDCPYEPLDSGIDPLPGGEAPGCDSGRLYQDSTCRPRQNPPVGPKTRQK